MHIENILVLTDFSEASKQAAVYSLQLAANVQAKVLFLHVYYIPPEAGGDVFIAREAFEGYEDSLQAQFKDFIHNLAFSEPASCLIRHGDLITEMNEVIEEQSVDLVVVGNREGGFLSNIIGSDTTKIIQHASCPVLSVPQKAPFTKMDRIAFASDLKESSADIFTWLKEFALASRAHLDIIHVTKHENEKVVQPVFLEEILKQIEHTFYFVWAKDIEAGIRQHLEEHHNDLLVLIPRQHPFFENLFHKSMTSALTFHSRVPVLTIHA